MKTIIAGSRRIPSVGLLSPADWFNNNKRKMMLDFLTETIKNSKFVVSSVVSGSCWGIDGLGEEYASANGLPLSIYPADWKKFGKKAGHVRNLEMAAAADCLVCVMSAGSRGSADMVEIMKNLKKPYYAVII